MRKERIRIYPKESNLQGECILYRMQASVRTQQNFALNYAIQLANEYLIPLHIVYCLDANYPEANLRHFTFLVQGLRDVEKQTVEMGCRFEILAGSPEQTLRPFLQKALKIVIDKGYTRIQRSWSQWIIDHSPVDVIEIEDNLIIPIESASHKQEWSARTIRTKLWDKTTYFMEDINLVSPDLYRKSEISSPLALQNQTVIQQVLHQVGSRDPLMAVNLQGGETVALALLNDFVYHKLMHYTEERNDPSLAGTSHLSAYLHFGQLSPLMIFHKIKMAGGNAAFEEQLLVRRELAHNYIYYNLAYDQYLSLPNWCRTTLDKHLYDIRQEHYSRRELENAESQDEYWNASMRQMYTTGFMENTMRMYWGKKIIEWSTTPEEAYATMLYLNNRYFLDGRDANSYVGVAWCFGLHDRPWGERPIFGTVRYMNDKGLEHKYDMKRYVTQYGTI